MNGEQLERVLRACPTTSRSFLGVYARDTVLEPLSRVVAGPCFVVANVADSRHAGLHWVLLFRDDRAYYVDSLARPPDAYGLNEAARVLTAGARYKNEFYGCPYAVQADSSNVCGLYCVYFAVRLCEGTAFAAICDHFSSADRYGNDAAVVAWTKKRFRLDSANSTATIGQTSRPPDDIAFLTYVSDVM
jgi:hypothetical protein